MLLHAIFVASTTYVEGPTKVASLLLCSERKAGFRWIVSKLSNSILKSTPDMKSTLDVQTFGTVGK